MITIRRTELDTQSQKLHDADYKTVFNLENSRKRIAEYDAINLFSANGFKPAVERSSPTINTHIDIGCGTGWLILKTSPYFKKVIGIDPSENGTKVARELTKGLPNVEFIVRDMIEGVTSLNLKEPVFITTAVVLSHIKDFHVAEFLKTLNSIPHGSALYFDEPYDTNIQQNMWHVRSREWWANNLQEWELSFEAKPGIYPHGIYGKKVGKENRKNTYAMSLGEHVIWFFAGISNKIKRLGRGIRRLFIKKSNENVR